MLKGQSTMDKRKFHYLLNTLKDEHEKYIDLIESIQEKFEDEVKPITPSEIKALKQHPLQFVKKIPLDNAEWTTQLHIWAEQGVPEILNLDPILLAFKNSNGDSVLMCLVSSATGAYTEKIKYDLIQRVLDTDLSYVVKEKNEEGKDTVEDKNALDVKDLNGQTPIDFLIDFAFGTGIYKNYIGDPKLQLILKKFSESNDIEKAEEVEESEKVEKANEAENGNESDESDESDEVKQKVYELVVKDPIQ